MRYSSNILDDIRSRLDIVQWISASVSLKKAGTTYKGLCPFHGEKPPSFTANPERQLFHCFGCGVGGDIFSFTMKRNGIGFMDAVKLCAEAAGVVLPQAPSTAKLPDDALHEAKLIRVNAFASTFFRRQLAHIPASHPLAPYLAIRQLEREAITRFSIGYAPAGWQSLVDYFKAKAVPLALAEAVGLLRQKDGRYYDFFRNRLIFPILSAKGEVIGFGGRQLSAENDPKYLNSPDSAVYHKRRALYGLHWSKPLIDAQRRVFIVEGYIDCLRMIINNYPAVAPLGTALTD